MQEEISRAKSAENINAGNDDTCFQDDLNGYASDSTVSCSSRKHTRHIDKKKRRHSSRKKQCSDLALKRDVGFFQSLGTKLLLNYSSSARMSSSRSIFKGSDNALLSAPGGSNESLVPPETKQRRKMSVCCGQLKGHARNENMEHSMISTRRTLDRKRDNSTHLPLRRWSMEKLNDDGGKFLPLVVVNTVTKVREDRKYHSLLPGWRGSNEKLKEHNRDPSLLDARIGSLDPTRGSLVPMRDDISRRFSSRTGSVVPEREHSLGHSLITTRRKSFDSVQPQGAFMCTRPRVHARRRRSPGKDDPVHSRISAKERRGKSIPWCYKPWTNSLTKKSTSKQVKSCKIKTQKRRHSFSSVEDYMAGSSENSTDCTDAHNLSHPPLAWQSGNKWIVYGFV